MARAHKRVAVVAGPREFPADMLRYDRCRPAREVDSMEMMASWENRTVPRVIIVRKCDRCAPAEWAVGRWESFGWKVKGTYATVSDAMMAISESES